MVRVRLPSAIQPLSRGGYESLIQQFGGFRQVAFAARQALLQIGSDISTRSVCVAFQRTNEIERRDDSPLPRPVPRLFQPLGLFVRTSLLGENTFLQCDRFDGPFAAQGRGIEQFGGSLPQHRFGRLPGLLDQSWLTFGQQLPGGAMVTIGRPAQQPNRVEILPLRDQIAGNSTIEGIEQIHG